jgi:hypothetical protein
MPFNKIKKKVYSLVWKQDCEGECNTSHYDNDTM